MMGAAAKPHAYTKREISLKGDSFQAFSNDASGVLVTVEDKAKGAFVPETELLFAVGVHQAVQVDGTSPNEHADDVFVGESDELALV